MKGIDEALDQENHDELESAGPPRPKILTAYLGSKKNAENMQWIEKSPEKRGRQRLCDVIKYKPSLRTEEAKSVENIRDAFDLFTTEEMGDLIVDCTHQNINSILSNMTDEVLRDDTCSVAILHFWH